jgi:hypothetical protein
VLQTSLFSYFSGKLLTGFSALSLFVLGVFADDADNALSLNDFAFFAHGLDRRSNFHFLLLSQPRVAGFPG